MQITASSDILQAALFVKYFEIGVLGFPGECQTVWGPISR